MSCLSAADFGFPACSEVVCPARPSQVANRRAFLRTFADQSGAGVRASQVIRALLDELETDPDLATRTRVWAAKK